MDFGLKLLIDPKDLPIVRGAQQKITLAKPVSGAGPEVVWLAIDPFAATDVEWQEQYGIYASTTQITEGATITKLSEADFPAQDGASYTFTPNATFNGPNPSNQVPQGSFEAQNDMPYSAYPSLTFGLTQSAMVNQKPQLRKPISATPVLSQQTALMTPFTEVYVWLQANFVSETIITQITGKYAKVRFGGGVNNITMKYSGDLGVFVPVDGNERMDRHADYAHLHIPTTF